MSDFNLPKNISVLSTNFSFCFFQASSFLLISMSVIFISSPKHIPSTIKVVFLSIPCNADVLLFFAISFSSSMEIG